MTGRTACRRPSAPPTTAPPTSAPPTSAPPTTPPPTTHRQPRLRRPRRFQATPCIRRPAPIRGKRRLASPQSMSRSGAGVAAVRRTVPAAMAAVVAEGVAMPRSRALRHSRQLVHRGCRGGGSGGTSTGGSGGQSYFDSTSTCRATGGAGASGRNGGAGGAGTDGDTLHTGGEGGDSNDDPGAAAAVRRAKAGTEATVRMARLSAALGEPAMAAAAAVAMAEHWIERWQSRRRSWRRWWRRRWKFVGWRCWRRRPGPDHVVRRARRCPMKLTFGFALTADDPGAAYTAHSLLLHHRDVADEVELVVVDNSAASSERASLLEKEIGQIPNARYIRDLSAAVILPAAKSGVRRGDGRHRDLLRFACAV